MEPNMNLSCTFSANEFIFPQRNKQIMKIKYRMLGFTSLQQCNGAEANTHKVIRISKSRVNEMHIQMNGLASARMSFPHFCFWCYNFVLLSFSYSKEWHSCSCLCAAVNTNRFWYCSFFPSHVKLKLGFSIMRSHIKMEKKSTFARKLIG